MKIKTPPDTKFKNYHSQLLKHLRLKGLQPKTIEAYERGIKRIYTYFNGDIEDLSQDQMLDYFDQFLLSNSWSGVKLDLYGLRFFTMHVLKKPWVNVPLIKQPKSSRIPDIVTVKQAQMIFDATNKLSYKVLFFTFYSLGLRLSEGINLKVADIDGIRKRVHIRNAKGNKDRLVPISDLLLSVLRKFWLTHQNPVFIFPNRKKGLNKAYRVTSPLDRGGVQKALKAVVKNIGLKKTSLLTA
jgi:site-specific recombinase XerD